MTTKTIKESFKMRKNINRDNNGIKRRLTEEDVRTGKRNDVSGSSNRHILETSPIFHSQREITWSIVSPDCAERLQPRKLDAEKIRNVVDNTINSFKSSDPGPSELGYVDKWLDKKEVVYSPPASLTPKFAKKCERREVTKGKPRCLEMRDFFDKERVSKISKEVESSSSHSSDQNKSNAIVNESEEIWDEDELFNDTDFLASTQNLTNNYFKNASSVNQKTVKDTSTKLPSVVKSVAADVPQQGSVSNMRTTSSTVIEKTKNVSVVNVPFEVSRQGSVSNIRMTSSVVTEKTNNLSLSSSCTVVKVPEKTDESLSWDDDDDEIDRIMSTIDCPNIETDFANAPTQIINIDEREEQYSPVHQSASNSSFHLDSDDSFGSDFNV